MYSNIEVESKPGRKLKTLSWSCNCAGTKKDNYITVDGEGKCVLCGHYGYRIENHVLNAERTWLTKVYKSR